MLLDTNVVSAMRRLNREAPAFQAWARRAPADAHLSSVTLLELEQGALSVRRRDERQGAMLREWIDGHVLPNYAGRILPVDAAVAQAAARLHVPDPRPIYDALIAATALVHGLTVVTRNVADFAVMRVPTLDPWGAG